MVSLLTETDPLVESRVGSKIPIGSLHRADAV